MTPDALSAESRKYSNDCLILLRVPSGAVAVMDNARRILNYLPAETPLAELPWPVQRGHVFYETDDIDAPSAIKDRNGDVVLALCRVCKKGEADLAYNCPGEPAPLVEVIL